MNRSSSRMLACAAAAALVAGCSENAGDPTGETLEQSIRAHYEARDFRVVRVDIAPDDSGENYAGSVLIEQPTNGEQSEVRCSAEPSDDDPGGFAWQCGAD
ncbi:MAG: hypothetical protein H7X93_10385 [Sphingomonadaceae bacterium]|nr:hypothetical protein [Sphingomonadaceae bacterium]